MGIYLLYSGIKKEKKKKSSNSNINRLGIFDFIKYYFKDYQSFLKKYVIDKKPAYWLLILWFYGLNKVLIRFSESPASMSIKYHIDNYSIFWISAVILGIIIAFIAYYALGSIFHLAVMLAGGKGKMKNSRLIFLYSSLPYTLSIFVLILINMLILRRGYFESNGMDLVYLLIITVAHIYSLYLNYKGAIFIQKTKKIRSIIIMIVFPILLQIMIYAYYYAQLSIV